MVYLISVGDGSQTQLGETHPAGLVSVSMVTFILPNGSGKLTSMVTVHLEVLVSQIQKIVDLDSDTLTIISKNFTVSASNAHAQTLQPQPHSAGVTNTLTLPQGETRACGSGFNLPI